MSKKQSAATIIAAADKVVERSSPFNDKFMHEIRQIRATPIKQLTHHHHEYSNRWVENLTEGTKTPLYFCF
jgi:hypothetical protein